VMFTSDSGISCVETVAIKRHSIFGAKFLMSNGSFAGVLVITPGPRA
jgi:hypothetical protein